MLQVDGYHGFININGKRFEKDVIIHADGSITERPVEISKSEKSDYFHIPLTEKELGFVDEEKPEVVIIGLGFKAMLPITPRAKERLSKYELKAVPTYRAIELVQEEKRKFIAILHLTC
jgi:hypothetical protein